jgi:alpha-beta hydrolase superfamily lysophospholipase
MKHEQGQYQGTAGLSIFWQAWLPEPAHTVFLLAHGLGEHSGRYTHVADSFSGKGYAVFALDHRGHGKSAGKRGHVEKFADYIADLDLLRHRAAEQFSGKKIFLLGHSLGGLIAAHYALAHPDELSGLLTSSAAFKVKIEANPVKLALGRFFSKHLPGLTMGNELDPNYVSRDPAVVKAYLADPLVHDRVSARWFTEFVAAIAEVQARAPELRMPLLVMQSGDDKLVAPEGAREFFDKAGSADKTLKLWPGFFHEMFNEPEKAEVMNFTSEWLDARRK